MNAEALGLCMITLGLVAWLWWRRKAGKTATLLALLVGLGIGPPLGLWLGRRGTGLVDSLESPAMRQIGVVLFAVLTAATIVVILEVLIHGIWPRTARPQRWHPWVALALPMVAIAFGVPVVAWAFSGLSTEIAHATTLITAESAAQTAVAAGDAVHDVATRPASVVASG